MIEMEQRRYLGGSGCAGREVIGRTAVECTERFVYRAVRRHVWTGVCARARITVKIIIVGTWSSTFWES